MKKKLLTISALFYCLCIFCQNYTLQGIVTDDSKLPLPYANLQLMKNDTLPFQGEVTNENGTFHFKDVPAGTYLLQIHFMGFDSYTQSINLQSDLNLNTIVLRENSIQLEGVTINAVRPVIKRQLDRYTISLANTFVGGKSTLDVLKFAPGVMLDKNESILLNRQKATVIVNNRQLRMGDSQLNDYLLSLNSEDIESIEILPSPTSDMDAEGTGGIIKINLKKGAIRGTNGYVNAGYSQGVAPGGNGSFGLNYNKNAFTVYGSYSYNHNENYVTVKETNQHENSAITLKDYTKNHHRANSHSFRGGIDYAINEKHTLMLEADGNVTDRNTKNSSARTEVYRTELDTVVKGVFPSERDSHNYGLNLNYVWNIDENGSSFKFITDYFSSQSKTTEDYHTDYFDASETNLLSEVNRNADTKNEIRIFSSKMDFQKVFSEKIKLETGLKYSYVDSENDNKFFKEVNSNWEVDQDRTDKYNYKENIFAAYANLSFSTGKFQYAIGLRGENTNYRANFITTNTSNKDNYFQLFPTAFISYDIKESDKIIINYNRRISRPEYRIMNPFEYLINEYNIKKGNPDIKPSYSNNLELTYSLKESHFFTLTYTQESDIIGEYYKRNENDITYQTFSNLANYNGIFLTAFSPFKITRFWNMDTYLTLGYHAYKEPSYKNDSYLFDITSTNYLILPKGFKAEAEFIFVPEGIVYQYDQYKTNMFIVNFSLQKELLKRKFNIRLYANDIFNSQSHFTALNRYQGQYIHSKIHKDICRVGISARYNFDWGKKFSKNHRERSNQEEMDRK